MNDHLIEAIITNTCLIINYHRLTFRALCMIDTPPPPPTLIVKILQLESLSACPNFVMKL